MRRLDRFWKSLDHNVGLAASRCDRRGELGDEWDAAQRFLKARGDIAPRIGCPSPGGDGCPRHVLRMGLGGFRAVCANSPRECDSLDLALADVEVLTVDSRRIAMEIATALEVEPHYREQRGVMHLGRHLIAAGTGFPVTMVLGSAAWRQTLHVTDFEDEPSIVLMSSATSVDDALQQQLRLTGHRIVLLSDVLLDHAGQLSAASAPEQLFKALREQVRTGTRSPPRPPWSLPAGTGWEKLRFELFDLGEITVSTGGQTHPLRPEHLGQRNEKTGGFTSGWVLLTTVVAMNGDFSFSNPTNAAEKQMQLLNRALQDGLRLDGPPIRKLQRGEYAATFVAVGRLPNALAEISGDPFTAMGKKFRQLPGRKRREPGDE